MERCHHATRLWTVNCGLLHYEKERLQRPFKRLCCAVCVSFSQMLLCVCVVHGFSIIHRVLSLAFMRTLGPMISVQSWAEDGVFVPPTGALQAFHERSVL